MLITPPFPVVKTTGRGLQQNIAAAFGLPCDYAEPVKVALTPEAILRRLDAKVLPQAPEVIEWQAIKEDHAGMAIAGQWDDLLESLRFADQTRTAAAGGKRVATLISRGARAVLTAAIARQDWQAADNELARFEAIFDERPDDYGAAHLLAQAHLDLAWAQRGAAPLGEVSQAMWQDGTSHLARAEAVLAVFDPIEEMSPLLAGTRYQLVRGIEDGKSLCRDWYEDWCDLDPGDVDVHAAHAQHLLPHWFGTLAGFDRAATRAAALTWTQTGQAAYAVFYIAASEILGDFPPGMNLERFLNGLGDYYKATGCQYRVNIAAGVMVEMLDGFLTDSADWSFEIGLVRAALSDLMWNHLHEVHLSAWDRGTSDLALALSEVFGQALQSGARIVVRGNGLAARMTQA
jgi:hypothetical protein